MKLALKITPQRSTQYANMAQKLAIPELLASPVGSVVKEVTPLVLAGREYILADLGEQDRDTKLAEILPVLSRLGATSEIHEYFARINDTEGPFLRPLEPQFTPFVPVEMAEARRYKGKTNELFTQVLLNIAIFAGAYSHELTGRLRILDPLAGGGTTLFLALAAGYDSFGIELNRQDIETTEVFIRQYLHSEHIHYKEIEEKRRAGRRYHFEIGQKKDTRRLILIHADATQADQHVQEIPGGPRMHAIVGDLPYGIQHFGEIAGLLRKGLPVWQKLLLPGGSIALAWNATHIERASMVELIEQYTDLRVRNEPPYSELAHTVDRVIKKRDIVVGVKEDRP